MKRILENFIIFMFRNNIIQESIFKQSCNLIPMVNVVQANPKSMADYKSFKENIIIFILEKNTMPWAAFGSK